MTKTKQSDPLFVIFERHLYRSSTEDCSTETFIQAVVDDYINYLLSQGVTIPASVKTHLIDDLKEEVRDMTLKKTYGNVSVSEYARSTYNSNSNRKLA